MKTNYGEIIYNGKVFKLLEEANLTNRVLGGIYTDYNDAEDGDIYDIELKARAVDEAGTECTVYWIFQDIKGEDSWDLDDFDYGLVDRVEYNL